ncbi:hypothetical protein QTP88_003048 [Uroleucon formosanum]
MDSHKENPKTTRYDSPSQNWNSKIKTNPEKSNLQELTTNLPRNRGALVNKTGKWKNGLSFGTWNVRKLFKPGAVQCLVEEIERYKLRVVALQKIRWNDKGTPDIQDTTIFYGECNKHRQFATSFAVNKNLVPSVREFKNINPRISMIQ